jgi:hypothetical protein
LTGVDVSSNWATLDGGGVLNKQGTLAVSRTTFTGNRSGSKGGGIYHYLGTLSMSDVTGSGNRALISGGGLISWEGEAALDRVTLSHNHAGQNGGGLHVFYGVATLTNVTLSGNETDGKGGGLGNWGGITRLVNVTFGENLAAQGGSLSHKAGGWSASTLRLYNTVLAHGPEGGNCFLEPGSATRIVSEGYNLSSDTTCGPYLSWTSDQNDLDPKLRPLADNGGTTMTHLPSERSPVIDRGQCSGELGSDQRGITRPQHYACDIGSVEVQADYVWWNYVPLAIR